MIQNGTVTAAISTFTGTQFVCFCHWLLERKLFAGLILFTCTFQSRCQAPQAHRARQRRAPLTHRAASPCHRNVPTAMPDQVFLKILPVVCQTPPLKFGQIFTLFFYPIGSSTKKRKRQATTKPNSEPASSSSSDSLSTVDTSRLEGEDEKDFILPDYPSYELTPSDSSDSDPENASAENLSTGWSEKVTRVDTQFLQDHVGPQNIPDHINIQSTALSFLELFLDGDFWRLLNQHAIKQHSETCLLRPPKGLCQVVLIAQVVFIARSSNLYWTGVSNMKQALWSCTTGRSTTLDRCPLFIGFVITKYRANFKGTAI